MFTSKTNPMLAGLRDDQWDKAISSLADRVAWTLTQIECGDAEFMGYSPKQIIHAGRVLARLETLCKDRAASMAAHPAGKGIRKPVDPEPWVVEGNALWDEHRRAESSAWRSHFKPRPEYEQDPAFYPR